MVERVRNITSIEIASDETAYNNVLYLNAYEVQESLSAFIGEAQNDWSAARGLTVLDLGCGSMYHPNEAPYPSLFQPYFCRLFAVNGARVFGIDLYDTTDEDKKEYTHIATDIFDLVLKQELPQLPQLSGVMFDIIHSSRFAGLDQAPEFTHSLRRSGINKDEFQGQLRAQTGLLLKEGGILKFDRRVVRKVDGILKEK